MRRMPVLALLLFVASSALSLAAQQPTTQRSVTKAEEEVRKLEREWLDAYEQNNAEAMNRIVADDFTITFPNGSIQAKPQLMSMVRAVASSTRRSAEPAMRFHTEDAQSRAYGDTVILMGRVVTEYERDGKTVREQSRYTDTYVKRNGRWQVVASHLSNVAEPRREAEK